MSQTLEEFDAFKCGLAKDGVLAALQQDPETGLRYLTYHENLLDATKMIELFQPTFSSDRAQKLSESKIFSNWIHFIEEIEAGDAKEVRVADVRAVCHDDDAVAAAAPSKKVRLSLSDVLQFCCGLRHYTHASPIKVLFLPTVLSGKRMTGDTCRLKLEFPLNERYIEEEDFSSNVTEDICMSPYFGNV